MDVLPTATTAEELRRNARTALLPVGSFEQHGNYLPLATDTIIACGIASAINDAYDVFLLPPITISCSHEHSAWRGTVSIRAATLIHVVVDIAESLRVSGIDRLIVVNGHGGNYVLSNVVQEGNLAAPKMALFPGRHDWDAARREAGLASSSHDDMHAGEIETSLLLHLDPGIVREGFRDADHVSERPLLLTLGLGPYTQTGVIGKPSLASADKGRAVLRSLTNTFADTIASLT